MDFKKLRWPDGASARSMEIYVHIYYRDWDIGVLECAANQVSACARDVRVLVKADERLGDENEGAMPRTCFPKII